MNITRTAARLFLAVGVVLGAFFSCVYAAQASPSTVKAVPPPPPSSSTTTLAPPPASLVTAKSRARVEPDLDYRVTLSADPGSPRSTQDSTLTARSHVDVGPTPYWISIVDTSAHTYVTRCGSGTVCTASVTQPTPTTHTYVAYVARLSTAIPPHGAVGTSPTVSVTWSPEYHLSLSVAPRDFTSPTARITATSSVNVGPTPYFIEIFNRRTGALVTSCGDGTTCTARVNLPFGNTTFIAYIGNYSDTQPPPGIVATSNRLTVHRLLQPPRPTLRPYGD
ncbi:exported hypothetical protein [Frankia canadensis]|uniref:Fibronectin type-III domain-containing protein n=1 Tax=Frankia canadensis TaxID=1836972 RepID=A0A2I2KPB3_9ACTN|nr:hypothetical protein [Frankia canadensis]SNQ47490.1 exported hypothetical protein [Frankia canadensis]SOU54780.1 exported hypothetical protein [Frankia canadensis]